MSAVCSSRATQADGTANCRSARLAAGRERRMPIPGLAGFGKAAEPLGLAADRFDGLAQGTKSAQAGSGTAVAVPCPDV
jgi:hypothetical protein